MDIVDIEMTCDSCDGWTTTLEIGGHVSDDKISAILAILQGRSVISHVEFDGGVIRVSDRAVVSNNLFRNAKITLDLIDGFNGITHRKNKFE